jgi:hypothetical protein
MGVSDAIDEREAITRVAGEHLAIADAFMATDVETMLEAVDHHVGPVEGWIGRSPSGMPRRLQTEPEGGLDRTVGM